MAALRFAGSALGHRCRRVSPERLHSRKSSLVISCVSTSFPSRPTRRKNHLREKILKTLKQPNITKPSLNSPPLEEVSESGAIEQELESEKREDSEAGNDDTKILEELGEAEVSVPAGNGLDGGIGVMDRNSILKYAMWLVGAFVFQTVCAVWIFGSSGIGKDNSAASGNKESSNTDVGGHDKDKSRVWAVLEDKGNGIMEMQNSVVDSTVYVDELEMERKIEEIRVMAREVREKERLESDKSGYDSENSDEETDGEKDFRSGIEEEVDDRLIKLRKKLERARKKMPGASVGYSLKDSVRKADVENSGSDEGENNGALLFHKKYKFRGLPTDPVEKPKGFSGLSDYKINNSEESGGMEKGDGLVESANGGNGAVGLGAGEKLPELLDVDSKRSDVIHVVEEHEEKEVLEVNESTESAGGNEAKEGRMGEQGKGKRASKPKAVLSEKNNGRSTLGAVKSRKLNTQALKSRKSNDRKNGSRDHGVQDSKSAVESKTSHWWSNLPYVLAIIMQRGYNGEGGEGFYTLKSRSSRDHQTSHIIAFEDRGDATNFCYLLQSFFEDLEDFRADVVPLTTQELNEAVKSHAMRTIVVKRGQLGLYAGQPLDDAEMALRALIEQG